MTARIGSSSPRKDDFFAVMKVLLDVYWKEKC